MHTSEIGTFSFDPAGLYNPLDFIFGYLKIFGSWQMEDISIFGLLAPGDLMQNL